VKLRLIKECPKYTNCANVKFNSGTRGFKPEKYLEKCILRTVEFDIPYITAFINWLMMLLCTSISLMCALPYTPINIY